MTLSACSGPREYYALSSEAGTPVGSMQIKASDGQKPAAPFTLDAKNPVAMRDGDVTRAAPMEATELRNKFKAALSAQPLPPTRFTLYFTEGGDTLTAESQTAVTTILNEIKQRPAPDLVVIGHTDRVGSVNDNDKLSTKRSESIRQQLIARGIDAESIQASGRGEREPLVMTADEIAEPRNRRVEILVR
jgi:outer membrane protein OmpA-like peptidoglycan-associated protein